MSFAFPSLEEILAEHLPEDKLDKVMRILYGRPAQRLEVTEEMKETGRAKDFELQKWSISFAREGTATTTESQHCTCSEQGGSPHRSTYPRTGTSKE